MLPRYETHGKRLVHAEWHGSWIDQRGGSPVFFHGSYFQVSHFLTGELRNYRKQDGAFGGVTVDRPVLRQFLSDRHATLTGMGAWEVTARIGYLDYFDSNTPRGPQGELIGVRLPQTTLGVNG